MNGLYLSSHYVSLTGNRNLSISNTVIIEISKHLIERHVNRSTRLDEILNNNAETKISKRFRLVVNYRNARLMFSVVFCTSLDVVHSALTMLNRMFTLFYECKKCNYKAQKYRVI